MTPPPDPRRRAFAEALGRLVADLTWREIVGSNGAPQKGAAPPAFAGEAGNGAEHERGEGTDTHVACQP